MRDQRQNLRLLSIEKLYTTIDEVLIEIDKQFGGEFGSKDGSQAKPSQDHKAESPAPKMPALDLRLGKLGEAMKSGLK